MVSVFHIRVLHIIVACIHVTWAILGGTSSADMSNYVIIGFARTVYDPNAHKLSNEEAFRFHTLKCLLAVSCITSFAHVGYAFLPQAGATRGNIFRFIEYAITATLLTQCVAVTSGATQIEGFIMITGASIALQTFGIALERMEDTVGKITLLFGGFTLQIFLVTTIGWHVNTSYSMQQWIAAAYTMYYTLFGINSALHTFSVSKWNEDTWAEYVYIILSVCSKTALFWLVFGEVHRSYIMINDPSVDWRAVQISASVVPLIALPLAISCAWLNKDTPEESDVGSTFHASLDKLKV